MKTKDLKVGSDYAASVSGNPRPRDMYLSRVRVLVPKLDAVEVFYGESVKVERLADDGSPLRSLGPNGRTIIRRLRPQQLLMPWAEYEEQRNLIREKARIRVAREDALNREFESLLADLNEQTGLALEKAYHRRTVTLDRADLQKILDALDRQ